VIKAVTCDTAAYAPNADMRGGSVASIAAASPGTTYATMLGASVRVVGALPPWTRWLSPHVKFERDSPASTAFELRLEAAPSLFESSAGAYGARSIRLHGDLEAREAKASDGAIWVTAPQHPVKYRLRLEADHVAVLAVCRQISPDVILDGARLLRGMLTLSARRQGWHELHMALIGLNDLGIAFVGPKRSGKTSFLLGSLATGSSSLVTNDKALACTNDRDVLAAGLPLAVSADRSTVASAALDSVTSHQVGDKRYFWPADIAAAYSAGISPIVGLNAVVRVAIDPSSSASVTLERVGEGAGTAALLAPIFGFSSAMSLSWLAHVAGWALDAPPVDILASLPVFTLRGNPWDTASLRRSLTDLARQLA
jgi:nucleotide-binding universal stress UspA family protein